VEVRLTNGPATLTIDPDRGGRIASLSIEGLELLIPAPAAGLDDDLTWGCYPMAPFAGRVRDGKVRFAGAEHQLERNLPPHAIHGTVFRRPWKVDHAEATDAVLVTDLGDGWPWPGRVVHRVRLGADGLDLRLEVYAEDEAFPASCGWHPCWRRRLARGEELELDLDAGAMWVRGADGVPTGELVAPPEGPWDDCFTDIAQPPVLRWPGALAITVESTCMDLVVFDEPRDSVCVEPQTGPPDALRLAPVVVEPGLPLVAEVSFTWRRL
jgi:aldose 1-epimerase